MSKCNGKPKALHVDYRKLEQDLQGQIKEDELYWKRNDAKLRAVTQGTPTYEDFRQIVMAAHLKPVSREEKEDLQRKSMIGKVIWNLYADGSAPHPEDDRHGDLIETDGHGGQALLIIPKNTEEFVKTWKSLNKSEEKLAYTIYLDTEEDKDFRWWGSGETNKERRSILRRICHEEFPPEIFPDLIQCVFESLKGSSESADPSWKSFVRLLYTVSQSKRFKIGLSFLREQDKKRITVIFATLDRLVAKETHRSVESSEEHGQQIRDLFDNLRQLYDPICKESND